MDGSDPGRYTRPMRKGIVAAALVVLALACNKTSSSADLPLDQPAATSGATTPAPAPTTTGALGALKSALTGNTQPFEGEITVTSTHANHPAPETMLIALKGQRIRFSTEAKGPGGAGILDLKDKKIIMTMDAQKKFIEMDLGSFNPAAAHGMPMPAAPAAGTAAPATPPKIDKTGKHETVAGHDCEDWTITDSNGHKAVVCMASDVGAFDFGGMEAASFVPSFLRGGFFGGPVFPLKAVELDEAGKETSRIEATRIERKSLDDATFAPPPGYTKLDLGNMGGMGTLGAGHMARRPAP